MPSSDARILEILNPADRQDDFTQWLREEAGYLGAKRLDDGTYLTVMRLLTTLALCFNCGAMTWERRYCFADAAQAIAEYTAATTNDYQPTGWIATRPER